MTDYSQDLPPPHTPAMIITTLGPKAIRVEFDPPPIPPRQFDWHATFDDYDGAPDAGFQPIGYGLTAQAAIIDLLQQEADHHAPTD